MILYAVLAIVAIQRIAEVIYAECNTQRLRAKGAVEIAAWQHPLFIALHATWLISLLLFVPSTTMPNWWLIGIFFALQFARLWIITALGPYWTTRIITLPEAPLVRRGPYRFMKHPNYTVVVIEIALLPAAFHAWWIALVFTALNGALLTVRVRTEDGALRARRTLG